jgi:hypothetical protein
LIDGLHPPGATDDLIEAAALALRAPEGAVLLQQTEALQRLLDDQLQLVDVERLLDEVVGAELEGLARRLDGREGGHHHDGHLGEEIAHGAQQLDARHVRHLDVRDDQVGRLRAQQRQSGAPVLGRADLMARPSEDQRQQLPHALFVVND